MLRRRLKFFFRIFTKIFNEKKCPNCGGESFEIVDKKYFITVLLRCKRCFLMHRHPKESLQWGKKFYQNEYKIDNGLMTELPSDNQINILKKTILKV